MAHRIELTDRAERDLQELYRNIRAADAFEARKWFAGIERLIAGLDLFPARGSLVPEDQGLRQVIYGRRPHRYRVIYAVDDAAGVVTVIHIRHGARDAFKANPPYGG